MKKIDSLIEEKNKAHTDSDYQFSLEQEIFFFNKFITILNDYSIKEQMTYVEYYGHCFTKNVSPQFHQHLFEQYYENKNHLGVSVAPEVLQDIIYKKKVSWTNHHIIYDFLQQYPNANIKKAGLLIELVSSYDQKEIRLSNRNPANQIKIKMYQHFFNDLLIQWQKEDKDKNIFNAHLSYYLIHSFKVHKKQKRLHSYIFKYIENCSKGIEVHYPELIDQYKKTSILKFLLDIGYHHLYRNNTDLSQNTITFFIENNFLEQAQLFIDYFGLNLDTLDKAKKLMAQKGIAHYSENNQTRIKLFDAQLETGYLNHQMMQEHNISNKKIKI